MSFASNQSKSRMKGLTLKVNSEKIESDDIFSLGSVDIL